jgi:tetratricopeptide (TPR) repeat protein
VIHLPFLSDDSAERAQFLKLFVQLGIWGFILLGIGECRAYGMGMIDPIGLALLLLLNLPVLFLISLVWFHFIGTTALGFSHAVYGGGNLPPAPAHSGSESLAARGLYREAAEAFNALIRQNPADNLARIKLAELHRRHLGEPDEAERLLQEVRASRPEPRHEFLAANLLLELHQSTGRRDRLMVELARFADRYRGTRAGQDAARRLREMKEEMRQGE